MAIAFLTCVHIRGFAQNERLPNGQFMIWPLNLPLVPLTRPNHCNVKKTIVTPLMTARVYLFIINGIISCICREKTWGDKFAITYMHTCLQVNASNYYEFLHHVVSSLLCIIVRKPGIKELDKFFTCSFCVDNNCFTAV